MISMEVRDKDGIDFAEMHMRAAELHLCPFAAIYHESLTSQFYDLRGGIMFKGGQRTATP